MKSEQCAQEAKVYELACETAGLLGIAGRISRDRVVVNADYLGLGYGIVTPAISHAVQLAAREEGLLLDPVYTGKAMDGLIDLSRKGFFSDHENIVFLHTGGSAGLFGYINYLSPNVEAEGKKEC